MHRHLDLTALRSFATVAETGGVTRAAGYLHLTQSAVSMQIKRLEEALGMRLLERSGRGVVLTSDGEEVLSVARRMLALNDELLHRVRSEQPAQQVALGVPHDIVYPLIPEVLRQFSVAFPMVKIQLISSLTRDLKLRLGRGEMDMILTTESHGDTGAETLAELPLVWVGAPGGQTWRRRPLRLAMEHQCIFKHDVQKALDKAGIAWDMVVETNHFRSVGAMLLADLAVSPLLEPTVVQGFETIRHQGELPDLGCLQINLYQNESGKAQDALAAMLRHAFGTIKV